MLSARPQRPTGSIADRQAGTATKDRCTVAPNTCTWTARRLTQKPTSQEPTGATRSSSFRQAIFGQQLDLCLQLLDALREIVDQLPLRIGKSAVFQEIARVQPRSNYAPRKADHRRVIRHRADHYGPSPDLGVIANRNVAEDLRAGANDHIVSDGRVPLAFLFACPPQRYALIEHRVIANSRRLGDRHAHAMIDKTPPSDRSAGMNFNPRHHSIEL